MINEKIDWIISGVNHGPNIGKDIIYSGTVGGARQGALQNIPSMAFSIDSWGEKLEFSQVGYFLDNYFEKLMTKDTKGYFYNINFPNVPREKISGIKQTKPCHHHYYKDKLITFDSQTTGVYYWIKGEKPIFEKDEGTDAGAIKNKFISISAIKTLPEEYDINLDV
jgi:5'-nucleotidase